MGTETPDTPARHSTQQGRVPAWCQLGSAILVVKQAGCHPSRAAWLFLHAKHDLRPSALVGVFEQHCTGFPQTWLPRLAKASELLGTACQLYRWHIHAEKLAACHLGVVSRQGET